MARNAKRGAGRGAGAAAGMGGTSRSSGRKVTSGVRKPGAEILPREDSPVEQSLGPPAHGARPPALGGADPGSFKARLANAPIGMIHELVSSEVRTFARVLIGVADRATHQTLQTGLALVEFIKEGDAQQRAAALASIGASPLTKNVELAVVRALFEVPDAALCDENVMKNATNRLYAAASTLRGAQLLDIRSEAFVADVESRPGGATALAEVSRQARREARQARARENQTGAGQSAPDEDDEDDNGWDNDEGPGSRGDRDDEYDDDSHPSRAARVSTEREAAAVAVQALEVQLPARLGWMLEADFKAVCVISGRDGVVSVNAAEPLHSGSDRHALKQFKKLLARRSGGERKPAADSGHRGSPGRRNGRS